LVVDPSRIATTHSEVGTMSKTWFITGTSSGFGRLLTEMLLARGDRVVGTLRQPGALEDLRTRYGDALDVVIMDLVLPGMDGVAATREVKRRVPKLGVVVFTVHDRPRDVLDIIRIGPRHLRPTRESQRPIAECRP